MILVPMFEESERLLQNLAILHIDSATWRIGYRSRFAQIFVAIVEAAELGPFADDDIHAHGIAGHLIL